MRCDNYRERGLPIGRGVTEAAGKTVVHTTIQAVWNETGIGRGSRHPVPEAGKLQPYLGHRVSHGNLAQTTVVHHH